MRTLNDLDVEFRRLNRGDTRLVGFDPAPASDAIRSALRLAGAWERDRRFYSDDLVWEGVLVLLVDGVHESWVLRVDPEDGYRSTLAPTWIINADVHNACILQFAHDPIPVTLRYVHKVTDERKYNGVEVRERTTGHVWLSFGTNNVDDWYPVGEVRWTPKYTGRRSCSAASKSGDHMRAFFFGCYRDAGHYFWRPAGDGRLGGVPESVVVAAGCPWTGGQIDGVMQPGCALVNNRWQPTRPQVQGAGKLHHRNGWTAISFWDRSMDHRPGSNSTFMFNSLLTFEAAVIKAREVFVSVLTRMEAAAPLQHDRPALYDCGCSSMKIDADRCDIYAPGGVPRE